MSRAKNMDCAHVIRLLPALLDRDLEAKDAETAREHLAGCSACREEHEALAGTLTLLAERERPIATPERFAEMRRELRGELAAPARRRPSLPRLVFGSSLAAAAILVLMMVWQPWSTLNLQGNTPLLAQLETAGRESLEKLSEDTDLLGEMLNEKTAGSRHVSDMIDELDENQLDALLAALEALKG